MLQREVTDRITDEIDSQLDIEKVTADALAALAENAPRVPPVVVGLALAASVRDRGGGHRARFAGSGELVARSARVH